MLIQTTRASTMSLLSAPGVKSTTVTCSYGSIISRTLLSPHSYQPTQKGPYANSEAIRTVLLASKRPRAEDESWDLETALSQFTIREMATWGNKRPLYEIKTRGEEEEEVRVWDTSLELSTMPKLPRKLLSGNLIPWWLLSSDKYR